MDWFDGQIKERKLKDEEELENAFAELANSVSGRKRINVCSDSSTRLMDSIDQILGYWHLASVKVYEKTDDAEELLEYMLRPYGIMRRAVKLEKGWYGNACGPLLGKRISDDSAVAFLPSGTYGYKFYDDKKAKWIKVSKKNEDMFALEAICFYRPFPQKRMDAGDLIRYVVSTFTFADFFIPLALLAASVFIGIIIPKMNYYIFSEVIQDRSISLLMSSAFFLLCLSVSRMLLKTLHSVTGRRMSVKITFSVQSALMMRILSLPASFFRKFSSGELYNRIMNLSDVCNEMLTSCVTVIFTAAFSLLYITQIVRYSPSLVIAALTVIMLSFAVSVIMALLQSSVNKRKMMYESKESGMLYSAITGMRKIKLSGAENRVFARWAHIYAEKLKHPPVLLKLSQVINTAIVLTGNIVIYFITVKSGISAAQFYAFQSAYSIVSGAFVTLASAAVSAADTKTVFDMVKPVFDAVPETSDGKRIVKNISGAIEISNLSFGYNEGQPNIIDGISLKIRPGEYIAVTGKTGCGKSTLLNLLLGFEKPQRGAVYYDGRDMADMDLKSLRSKIGTVMQDGKLFAGSIFSNITISAPHLSFDDAWAAARIAGIADDIRDMPMGMNTIVSENSGGFSGGQKQRLLIARAIAPKPKILLFDEATSALDNVTQKKISNALAMMNCTRIVIAHRLSTIKHCSRILVLDNGKIAEDGTYEELIALDGIFAELIRNQKLDREKIN